MNAKPIPPNLDPIQQSRSRCKVHLTPPTGIQGAKPHANLVFVTQLSTGVQTEEISILHMTLKTDRNTDKNLGVTRLANNAKLTVSAPTNQSRTCWGSLTSTL